MTFLDFYFESSKLFSSLVRMIGVLLMLVVPLIVIFFVKFLQRGSGGSADDLTETIFSNKFDMDYGDRVKLNSEMVVRKPFDYRWFVMPNRSLEIRKILQKTDKNFVPLPMMNLAKELFIKLQNCWVEGNTGNVVNDLHPDYLTKLNDMIAQSYNPLIKMHIDNITFHNFYLTFYKSDKENVYVTIYLESQMIRYAEEASTGEIVSGSNTEREESVNLMKFVRPVGATSDDSRWLLYDFNLSVIGTEDEKIVIEDGETV